MWRGSRKCKDRVSGDDFASRILETILRTEGISPAAESGRVARRQARLRDAIRERYTEAMTLSLPLSESAEVLQQTEREMLVRVKSFLRFYEYFDYVLRSFW